MENEISEHAKTAAGKWVGQKDETLAAVIQRHAIDPAVKELVEALNYPKTMDANAPWAAVPREWLDGLDALLRKHR